MKDNGEKTYKVIVDYFLSIEELVASGEYDFVPDVISSSNFQNEITEDVKKEFKIRLIPEINIGKLDYKKYRHITIKLLSFGAQFPNIQRKIAIIGLGSKWKHAIGRIGVPCLWSGENERYAYLYWSDLGYFKDQHFAVALK